MTIAAATTARTDGRTPCGGIAAGNAADVCVISWRQALRGDEAPV